MTRAQFTCRLVNSAVHHFRIVLYSSNKKYFIPPTHVNHKVPFIIHARAMSTENGVAIADNAAKRRKSAEPVIGTHSGTFHCDEVLACFMLRQLPEYKNASVFRSRDDKQLREKCDIIVDVGGEFDHKRKWYDHHQRGFEETLCTLRPELGDEFKIKLSSAGLVYAYYGERVLESILQEQAGIALSPENLRLTYVQIYRNFVSEIDAIDNGLPMYETIEEPLYKIHTHLSARVGKLNPSWEEDRNSEIEYKRFECAMALAGGEFVKNVLEIGGSWMRGREHVRRALEQAKSVYETGEILMLECFCPWKAHLADLEKEYDMEGVPKLVIFSENEKSWRVAGVPVSPSSFLGRKFLPQPWRGLRDDELSRVAGIPKLVFVHQTGFIGGATTKEAALEMAIKSVQWKDE